VERRGADRNPWLAKIYRLKLVANNLVVDGIECPLTVILNSARDSPRPPGAAREQPGAAREQPGAARDRPGTGNNAVVLEYCLNRICIEILMEYDVRCGLTVSVNVQVM
jgi:hypothetical protein